MQHVYRQEGELSHSRGAQDAATRQNIQIEFLGANLKRGT